MLCIIPIAASDQSTLPGFAKWLTHLGPYPNDTCLFVVTPQVRESFPDMLETIHQIKGLFSNGAGDCVRFTPNTPEGGWPLAPNVHFMYAIDELSKFDNREPFLYLETDATGLTREWLANLKRDYAYYEKPYMGVESPTYELVQDVDTNTRAVKGDPYLIQNDTHMVGMGIYPADYIIRSGPQVPGSVLWNTNVLWKAPNDKKPFDIYCQAYHRPLHNTKLIKHLWHTKDYGVTPEGLVICKDLEEPKTYMLKTAGGISTGKPLKLSNAGTFNPEGVVLVHGCKDGSLADLVVGGYFEKKAPLTEVRVDDTALKAAVEENQRIKAENEKMKAKIDGMESKMDLLLERLSTPPAPQPAPVPSPPIATVEASQPAPRVITPEPAPDASNEPKQANEEPRPKAVPEYLRPPTQSPFTKPRHLEVVKSPAQLRKKAKSLRKAAKKSFAFAPEE